MLRSTWSSAASNAAVVWSSAASNGTVDPVKRKAKRNAKRCGRPGKVHRYLWACNRCAMMRLTRLTIAFTGIFRHDANRQPLSSDRIPFCHRTAPRRGNVSCSRGGSPAFPAPRTPARRLIRGPKDYPLWVPRSHLGNRVLLAHWGAPGVHNPRFGTSRAPDRGLWTPKRRYRQRLRQETAGQTPAIVFASSDTRPQPPIWYTGCPESGVVVSPYGFRQNPWSRAPAQVSGGGPFLVTITEQSSPAASSLADRDAERHVDGLKDCALARPVITHDNVHALAKRHVRLRREALEPRYIDVDNAHAPLPESVQKSEFVILSATARAPKDPREAVYLVCFPR